MDRPAWDRQFAETETERNVRLREKRKLAAARREGVIEGLTAAAEIARDPRLSNWALRRLIRVEIKRIKGE